MIGYEMNFHGADGRILTKGYVFSINQPALDLDDLKQKLKELIVLQITKASREDIEEHIRSGYSIRESRDYILGLFDLYRGTFYQSVRPNDIKIWVDDLIEEVRTNIKSEFKD